MFTATMPKRPSKFMMETSSSVANALLDQEIKGHGQSRLTPMHLQKLVYIAHGWHLAITNRPLTTDRIEAWTWGPVYPDLYDNLKRYGPNPVNELIHINNWASDPNVRGGVVAHDFTGSTKEILDQVYRIYGGLEAFQLSALTHNPGTPWAETYQPGHRGIPIDNTLIREHFVKLAGGAGA